MKWIKVTEQTLILDEPKSILVCWKDSKGKKHISIAKRDKFGQNWINDNLGYKIDYWMELPEFPKDNIVTVFNNQYEVEIIDSTHLRYRYVELTQWASPLHFCQVSDEMMNQLKELGMVEGNFFKTLKKE